MIFPDSIQGVTDSQFDNYMHNNRDFFHYLGKDTRAFLIGNFSPIQTEIGKI